MSRGRLRTGRCGSGDARRRHDASAGRDAGRGGDADGLYSRSLESASWGDDPSASTFTRTAGKPAVAIKLSVTGVA